MKQKIMAISVIVTTMLSGCSITTNVKPVTTKISDICIKKNSAVLMDGFLPELQSQIESRGIKTRVFDNPALNKDCPYQLEYTANWRWDLVMYLTYTDLKVYGENRIIMGEANYDATWGGGRLDKFGPTAEKLKTLTEPLFPHNP
jgi:hypothetical protein